MSRLYKHTIAFLTALFLTTGLWGQGEPSGVSKWNVTLQGGAGYVPRTFTWRDDLMSTYVYPTGGVRVGYQTTETGSPYAAVYGFPVFGIGLGWEGVSTLRYEGNSRLGNLVELYGFVERNLLRYKRFSLDLDFDLGVACNGQVYDPESNPKNLNFASHAVIYVGGGVTAALAVTDRLEAGVAARFSHYSAGRLAYPNGGLNDPSAVLSLRYRPLAAPRRDRSRPLPENPSRFFYELYAGGGVHRCAMEWMATGSTTPWPIWSFGGSANFRYRPHLSTGLAVDMNYASGGFMDCLEESERACYGDADVDAHGPYKPFSGGVGAIQHLHYGNFSAFAVVGTYLYRRYGAREQRGKLYQRVGLKYVVPGSTGLFVSLDCKAHRFSRAAMMEITFGIRR